MLRPDEVSKLMLKMKRQTDEVTHFEAHEENKLPERDVSAYIRANSWPGRNYALVGHSYNVEQKIVGTSFPIRRAACIAMMLEQGGLRRCVFVTEALGHEGFTEVLSRFELDWLGKLPNDTVLGPAYASTGELIGQSFAVWTYVSANVPVLKEPVNAGK